MCQFRTFVFQHHLVPIPLNTAIGERRELDSGSSLCQPIYKGHIYIVRTIDVLRVGHDEYRSTGEPDVLCHIKLALLHARTFAEQPAGNGYQAGSIGVNRRTRGSPTHLR
jgi:hypothetical protein